jgi:hypothetical protein
MFGEDRQRRGRVDDERFDGLTRALVADLSRWQGIRGLARVGAALIVLAPPTATWANCGG